MLKKNKWSLLGSSIIIVLPILFGLLIWNRLPEQVATHWGMSGEADGWSSRASAVFSMPIFILAVHWFCIFCTMKDPKNTGQNRKVFRLVLWICPLVSLGTSGMIYLNALGGKINTSFYVSVVMGLLFILVGNYLPKCRQNSTIGIRIKWTLENEENWNATHRFCGKAWVIGGIVLLACGLLPESLSIYISLGLLVIFSLLPFGYSYSYYRRNG